MFKIRVTYLLLAVSLVFTITSNNNNTLLAVSEFNEEGQHKYMNIKGDTYALLIGLNSVNHGGYKEGPTRGCEKDVDIVNEILDQANIDRNNIIELKTEVATVDSIISSLKYFSKILKEGDMLIFYFSGHGDYIWDSSGDEDDFQDELLVAYDSNIIDDSLSVIWDLFVPNVRVFSIVDACHSASVIKRAKTFRHDPDIRKLFFPSETGIDMIHIGAAKDDSYALGGDSANGSNFTSILSFLWEDGDFEGNYEDLFLQLDDLLGRERPACRYFGKNVDEFLKEKPFIN